MALSNNTFCWNGIVTTDAEKTLAFFPEVLGWQAQTVDMGGDAVHMFAHEGKPLAHVRAPQMDGEPSWWNNYFRVEDIDATVASVKANGGTILVPPTKIPVGTFCTIQTPSGATFTLYREANADDADLPTTHGFLNWVDLHSKDIDADVAFLEAALGLEKQTMPMPQGPYHILGPNTATRAGAMAGQHAEAPSMWMAWISVASVDETLGRVGNNGGNVIAPAWDVPGVGRLAIAADPAGVVFGVMTPAGS